MRTNYYGLLKLSCPEKQADLRAYGKDIATKGAGNVLSNVIIASIVVLLVAANDNADAVFGDPASTTYQKVQALDVIANIIQDLSMQYMYAAKGDIGKLETTGITLTKPRIVHEGDVGVTGAPDLKRDPSVSGTIHGRVDAVPYAGSYGWQISLDDWATIYATQTTISPHMTQKGLPRKSEAHVRCWAIGANGPGGVGPDSHITVL